MLNHNLAKLKCKKGYFLRIVIILNKPHCCEKLISLIIKYLAFRFKK